jgi:STE24 endopeptidase
MNGFWAFFVAFYILHFLFFSGLEVLNLRHLRRMGTRCPEIFRGFIDETLYSRTVDYTRDRASLGLSHEIVSEAVLLLMIVSGFLAGLDVRLSEVFHSPVFRGLAFFLTPALILHVNGLPFSYRHTFVVEERYGFNTTTLPRWVADRLKSGVLSLFIFCPLLMLVLWLIRAFPTAWWIWAFGAVSAVQLLVVVLYPCCIAPLFNRFQPLGDRSLAEKVQDLMDRNGIVVKRILEMDAGTRSRHSNAYFTGLGRTKQIVLFDTLIEAHPHEEILAVLAHEVGHFKGRHILKQLVVSEAALLLGFYLASRLLDRLLLTSSFGFENAPQHAGLFLLMILWQKAGAFLMPLFMALSRRFEREADAFSARMLGTPAPLITAFKRMAAHNLSNLVPHPLYVAFHYSHPPLAERIELLESA